MCLYGRESYSLLDCPYFNAIPYIDGSLGNITTFIGGGLKLELGYNVERSIHSQIPIKNDVNITKTKPIRAFLFASAGGRYVVNNIFLEGNTFKDYEYAVDIEHWVADFELGLGLQYNNVKLYIIEDLRTREYTTQDECIKGFGGVKLMIGF